MTPAHAHALHLDTAPEAKDFYFGNVLGQGSYAKVFHAQMKKNRQEFAVKVMDQSFIRKENKTEFVLTERKVMSRLSHPLIASFYCSFRDHHSLYLVLELCRGGDLLNLIRKEYQNKQEQGITDAACSFELTQFYMAELVIALEYMHSQHVIHRDIKPDNLLLSQEGHLKVIDFGTAKDQDGATSDVCQFCGTASYVSPEVLHDKPASRAADLWALGCLIFQMFTGRAPFVAENDYLTFQVIINHSSDNFDIPSSVPDTAQDLIRKLLVQDPDERIGAQQNEEGYAALKNHPFFEGIEWDDIGDQTPPYVPPKLVLPEPKLDGASENWTVADCFSCDFSESASDEFSTRRSRSSSSLQRHRPVCIRYEEQIRFEATVKVHSKLFKRTRDLYLTDSPRLVVISSWSGHFKREFILTPDTIVNELDSHTFEVVSSIGTTLETGLVGLLKHLRSQICTQSSCNLYEVVSMYQRLLSPCQDNNKQSIDHTLMSIRAKLISSGDYEDVVNVVDRMDQLMEQYLSFDEQLKPNNSEEEVCMSEMVHLLVHLAGGEDGETFVFADSMPCFDAGRKCMGDRIDRSNAGILQHSKAIFCKVPVPLDEKAFFSQNLFNDFGNGMPDHHASLWCPDSSIPDDEELRSMMSTKQRNRFFSIPSTPPVQADTDHVFISNDTPNRERLKHASAPTKSTGYMRCLPFRTEVCSNDSTQEVHCGVVQQVDEDMASSTTEVLSWHLDSLPDTTEPWIAQTYAWEDLGNRVGLPEDYCRPPVGNVTRSLHDLVIPNEFVGKSRMKEKLLEVHEADLIEDCLRALSGVDSTIFRRHFQSATFQLPVKHELTLRNTTVSATLSVLEVFRKAGTTLMRLELLAIYYSQDPSRGGKTLQLMGDTLLLYLSMHRIVVEKVAQQCLTLTGTDEEDKVISVTKLVCKTRKLCGVLEIVGHMFDCDNDVFWPLLQQGKFYHGVALLNHLHHHVSSLRVNDAAGHIQELAIWFLAKACSPFLAALSDLISSGRVHEATDPFNEFELTTWSRHLFEKAAAEAGDGMFGDDQSADAIQMLPTFMENIAPLVVRLSQVQALLHNANAVASTRPLVKLPPLFICTCSNRATELAKEWQLVIDEAMAYCKDIPHTMSTESCKDMLTEMSFAPNDERKQKSVLENTKAERGFRCQEKTILDWLERKQCQSHVVEEGSVNDIRQCKEFKEAEMDEEANGCERLINNNSALMSITDERHDCTNWRRDCAVCLSLAKEQLEKIHVNDQRSLTPNNENQSGELISCAGDVTGIISLGENNGNTTSVVEGDGNSLSITTPEELTVLVPVTESAKAKEETGAWDIVPQVEDGWSPAANLDKETGSHCGTFKDGCGTCLVEVANTLGNGCSKLVTSDTRRPSVKVDTQTGSHSFGIAESPASSTDMDSYKTGVRIINEPRGGGITMYETLYGRSDIVPTTDDTSQQEGTDCSVAASLTDSVGMHDSRRVGFPTTDLMSNQPFLEATVDKDAEMQDVVCAKEECARSNSDQDEALASNASDCVGEGRIKLTQVSLPSVHPFFSMAIPQEDYEMLTRTLTENNAEVDFTSFALIVNSCVQIPVRLVFQKLEQVAINRLRGSLQVLEHLRSLRNLMLMSEGLCMDIVARDFLCGLKSSTRVNWGAEDRLTSALTLAMIEGSVTMNVMTQNFHYKTTAALSQILSSRTMTSAVPSLLNEFELVYDVKWPLGLVITSRSLDDYKQLHQFLLHVRLTSVELHEVWGMLRTIRRRRHLSSALERLCGGVVYKTQAFLRAFNETFATKVLMSAWSELECAIWKATTLAELRCCHEEYVTIALCCCFLDTPTIPVRSAILATLTAAWKLTECIHELERQVTGQASDNTYARKLCDKLDLTLRALVHCLYNVSRNGEQSTRAFSECLLLRLNFNQHYSSDTIPTTVAASAT